MNTIHTATVTPKLASGPGAIDGFEIRCTCGDVASYSLESIANRYADDHTAYMAKQGR